jgi:hypothetical protein
MPAGPLTEPTHPDHDYLRIFHRAHGALNWESHRAHELAIFCTFAVPDIAVVLARTGEFEARGQRRYDDTVALLREIGKNGPDSPHGRAAIRHLNRIHRPYGIKGDDLRYVLATFVVVPVEWARRYGWRCLTDAEIAATVTFYQAVGRLMGIRQIPSDYADFAGFLHAYEREHHSYTEAGRRLAVSLIEVMAAWFPRPLRPLARDCVTAALGPPLRQALGLRQPSGLIRAGVHAALRSRAALLRLIPLLRRRSKNPRGLRTYPCGYSLSDLGPDGARGDRGPLGAGDMAAASSCPVREQAR